jgi:hypothetical protein
MFIIEQGSAVAVLEEFFAVLRQATSCTSATEVGGYSQPRKGVLQCLGDRRASIPRLAFRFCIPS